ncbi:MAG: hypothetical protein ACTHOA_10180 [Rhodanobacter sp.]
MFTLSVQMRVPQQAIQRLQRRTAKRGRRELSLVRRAVCASRPTAVPYVGRAAQGLFDHRLELRVAQRTLLFEVRADARQFVFADTLTQPGPVARRAHLRITILRREDRVRVHQPVL